MNALSKTFSRERSLFYIRIWNDSDRLGMAQWLNVNVLTSLFLREGKTSKMSVWYDLDEFSRIEATIEKVMTENPRLIEDMKRVLEEQWGKIGPYLDGKQLISSIDDFEFFWRETVVWWSVMAIFFLIPNLKSISSEVKDQTLAYRLQVEKYSDKIDQLLISYFEAAFSAYKDISFVIQPEEAFRLGREGLSAEEISSIKDRLSGFALFNGDLHFIRDFSDVLTKSGFVLEQERIDQQMTEIKGSSASAGLARGTVRLILLKSQVSELQEGEVLVTEMTNPDFVPAMKKAAAIITDEGGITCHAAIISRELGKPCIIGTKIATQVLRDADMVEVDANEGIVRIL